MLRLVCDTAALQALKVYVILTSGNEAGSAAMFVQRPASVQLLAA